MQVSASATCGLADNGEPIRELFCDLTGASQYNPAESDRDAGAPKDIPAPDLLLGAEARERQPIVQVNHS